MPSLDGVTLRLPVNDPVRTKQWALLEPLLSSSLVSSAFQLSRLPLGFCPPASLEAFVRQFPLTSKHELVADQSRFPPAGSNLTAPDPAYIRFSQTSGTTARPLAVWDTSASWDWLLENWVTGFHFAGVTPGTKAFFAFSFGPFLGFWTAFEAGLRMGLRCLPGGGLGTVARLQALIEQRIEVLCCTPTYALHLAAAAAVQGLDLSCSAVRKIIVAGEPGGSLPEVRRQILAAWPDAEMLDHYGLTEVGPVAFSKAGDPGRLHVLEERYLAEVLHPETLEPVSSGQSGELVLTPLGRSAWPLFRYRTGDLVRPRQTDSGLVLEGGILGRVDDMVIVRGVNLYPGAVEDVVRSVLGSGEYRVTLSGGAGLVQMELEVEAPSPHPGACGEPPLPQGRVTASSVVVQLEAAFERSFSLRIPVREVPNGSLPRFEFKARRWVRRGDAA
jgi:phenylacetate-CoA ligase